MQHTCWEKRTPFMEAELFKIAKHLFMPGKGIMSCDETISAMEKRFMCIGVTNNEESRRQWRKLLIETPKLEKYISGVILHQETVLQNDDSGENFVTALRKRGIVSGVQLDDGVKPFYGSMDEPITIGLENLAEKCLVFKSSGVHFAKWRSVLRISGTTPSVTAINDNAVTLARFASICQHNRLVPIIEPEIEHDGAHSLKVTQKVTEVVLSNVIKAMQDLDVYFEGAILKINFVSPGMQCPRKYSFLEMGYSTIEALRRTVPPGIQGICFLAGSLKEEEATNLMNAVVATVANKPWYLTYSFGRGLHMSALKIWNGNAENVKIAQEHLLKRLMENQKAALGKLPSLDQDVAATGDNELFITTHPFHFDYEKKNRVLAG